MIQVSKYRLDNKILEKIFALFFIVVGKKQSQEEFLKVIQDLFSPTERLAVAKRIAIIYLLTKEIDTTTICRVLKVTRATVAKFSYLTERSEGIVPSLKIMLRNEKIKLVLEEIFNTLYGPGTPGIDWAAAWQRKLEIRRKKAEGI